MSGGGSETTSNNHPPQYVMDQHQQNLQVGNILADRPYQPYAGPRIAGWTPDQQAGFQAVRDSVNNTSQMGMGHGVATGVSQYNVGQVADTDLSKYMNPFTRNVIDTTVGDMDRANQMALRNVQSQASLGGAYGGARMGLAQGETNRGFADKVAQTVAGLNSQNFTNAQNMAQFDIGAGLQGQQLKLAAAQQMAASALARQQRDFANAQALAGIGQQQQSMNQSNLDLARSDFERQMGYPVEQLQLRNGLLSGINAGSTGSQSTKTDNTGQLVGSGMMAAATVAAAVM